MKPIFELDELFVVEIIKWKVPSKIHVYDNIANGWMSHHSFYDKLPWTNVKMW